MPGPKALYKARPFPRETIGRVSADGRRIFRPDTPRLQLWMIAKAALWPLLRETGTLYADPERVEENAGEYSLPAYDWLREQMAERIPGYTNHYPWWAWANFKPYLRRRGFGRGAQVRIGLAVPADEVLLSCLDTWFIHYTWNRPNKSSSFEDRPMLLDRVQHDAWAALPETARTRADIEGTFARLFSPDFAVDPEYTEYDVTGVQATFEQLRLADVTEVVSCFGRG